MPVVNEQDQHKSRRQVQQVWSTSAFGFQIVWFPPCSLGQICRLLVRVRPARALAKRPAGWQGRPAVQPASRHARPHATRASSWRAEIQCWPPVTRSACGAEGLEIRNQWGRRPLLLASVVLHYASAGQPGTTASCRRDCCMRIRSEPLTSHARDLFSLAGKKKLRFLEKPCGSLGSGAPPCPCVYGLCMPDNKAV
jgi:hypothetical protein